jgi:RNA polymerase sigma-70 factor (ECF subfamily)
MPDRPTQLTMLSGLVKRVADGDAQARGELIAHACSRLERLVRSQLRTFPAVRRWDETGDVLNNVVVRLHRALEHVRPKDVREFFAFSGTMIRRELIDLKRHYYGPEGLGANYATKLASSGGGTTRNNDQEPVTNEGDDPSTHAGATELHAKVEQLPDELREVVTLLYYQGLTMEEAGQLLGTSSKTISRRWRAARLQLGRWLRE